MKFISLHNLIVIWSFILIFYACSGQKSGSIEELDQALVAQGNSVFTEKCMKCHSLDDSSTGPALRDITKRRDEKWILSFIMNSDKMIKEDPEAKKLWENHQKRNMIVTNVDLDQAKAVLEYLKSEAKK
jgi:mono/diheme cytochrome c family protein